MIHDSICDPIAKKGVLKVLFGKKNPPKRIEQSKREAAAVVIQKRKCRFTDSVDQENRKMSLTDCRGFLVRCKYHPVLELRRKSSKISHAEIKIDKRVQEIHRRELETFAMQVFHLNQENQRHQHLFKDGVQRSEIMDEPPGYVRPEGFKIIPKMLAQLRSQVTKRY